MNETPFLKQSEALPEDENPKVSDAPAAMSPTLARLIEEVRNEHTEGSRAYDRVHNRHNR